MVVVDPPREPAEFDSPTKIRVSIPKNSNAEIVYPDSPSYFAAVGSNLFARDIREVRDVRTNARLGSIRNTTIFSGKKALSPDGRHFAAWTHGQNTIGTWDVKAETQVGQLRRRSRSPAC